VNRKGGNQHKPSKIEEKDTNGTSFNVSSNKKITAVEGRGPER